jgi:hypothetical protein
MTRIFAIRVFLFAVIYNWALPAGARDQQDDVSFLLRAIKESYIGYERKSNGNAFNLYAGKVIKENKNDTFRMLSLLTAYFNDPHLRVAAYKDIPLKDTAALRQNLNVHQTRLANKVPARKSYEGFWKDDYNDCIVLITKVTGKRWTYEALVVESRNNALPVGLVCIKFEPVSSGGFLCDHITAVRGSRIYLNAHFRNDSTFTLGAFGKWKRLADYKPGMLQSLQSFDDVAYSKWLDSNTFLLTIPSNSLSNTKIVDSIIKSESEKLANTKNLIIDLRNNLGGTVQTYEPLIPYVYTGPIREILVRFSWSKALVESEVQELEYYKEYEPSDSIAIAKKEKRIKKLKDKLGQIAPAGGATIKLDSVMANPKNVGIIVNYSCYSAAEMMLLDFKQSAKVLVFGEHTYGGVDYLDEFTLQLPSKKYRLDVPSSERILPDGGQWIDGKGIEPDISISDSETNWVEFVHKFYQLK